MASGTDGRLDSYQRFSPTPIYVFLKESHHVKVFDGPYASRICDLTGLDRHLHARRVGPVHLATPVLQILALDPAFLLRHLRKSRGSAAKARCRQAQVSVSSTEQADLARERGGMGGMGGMDY